MVGKSVRTANEIRDYIKSRALLGGGSKSIYADICTVYGSNEMPFSTVADGLENLVQAWTVLKCT